VGIWTADGSLFAEVFINAGTGSTLDGMFRYGNLESPVLLEQGGQYVIGAYYPAVSGFQFDRLVTNVHPLEVASGLTLGTTQFRFGQNMPFPNFVTINKPYVGPTLRFQVVPEPTCPLCLATGISLAIILRRRRFE